MSGVARSPTPVARDRRRVARERTGALAETRSPLASLTGVARTNNNCTGPVQEMVAELQKRLGLGE